MEQRIDHRIKIKEWLLQDIEVVVPMKVRPLSYPDSPQIGTDNFQNNWVNHFFLGIAIHMVPNQRLIITRVILNIEMPIAQHPRQ